MRIGALICAILLSSYSLAGQSSSAAPATISVLVVEGDGSINSIRYRRAREPVVRVVDESGEPLSGASVIFLLPSHGASGSFGENGPSFTAQTDEQGHATGRGLHPNTVAGQFRIRVTASWHGSTATASLLQTNAEPVVQSGHSKTIAIIALVAGAVAGGAAAAAAAGKSGSAAPAAAAASTQPAGSISPGPPTLGPPH